MIILDSTTESLEILLAGAVTTNQLPFTASYADHNATAPSFTPGSSDGQTNNTTAVTLVGNPGAGVQRQVKRLNVYNADTAQATVTIRLNNGGTLRTQFSIALQTGERIEYEDGKGFSVYTVTGAQKVTAVQSTVEPGYIDGMNLTWNSTTQIEVSSGTCYIPSVGANVNFPSAIAINPTLSASTFFHVYAFLNSGVPAIEAVTTAPSTPYNGKARTKTGDTTRRYLGTILTNASSQIYQFQMDAGGLVRYLVDGALAPFRALSGGMATSPTTVSLAAVMPITTRLCILNLTNLDATQTARMGQPALGALNLQGVRPNSGFSTVFESDSSQQVSYFFPVAPASGFFIDVLGYWTER